MTWMRQWRAGDVLKLLAVVLPALLFVGAGLGWIVQEYHRKADRRVAESATTAALSFYRKINENEQGRYLSDPRKLNGEYRQQWKRDLQQLQDRLSAFVRDIQVSSAQDTHRESTKANTTITLSHFRNIPEIFRFRFVMIRSIL